MADVVCDNLQVKKKTDFFGDVKLHDNLLWLRAGDVRCFAGLGFFSSGWANTQVNGPVLYGNLNGALGTFGYEGEEDTHRIALLWDIDNNVKVIGDLTVGGDIFLANADCAEDFDIGVIESVQPGTVMVLDNDGSLQPSEKPYDKRVAGVISGAGDFRPGITLDKQDDTKKNRLPLALTGKVYCKVDADYEPIEVGDLLTTSSTPGHAMKADDPVRSFGAVIGKAVQPLKAGRDFIPLLVSLQ